MLEILKARFQDNKNLHMELSWLDVEKRLLEHPGSMDVLRRMEESGGEPDTIGYDEKALQGRAKNPPSGSAEWKAKEIGVLIMTEELYRRLQSLGEFDLKTSSWIATPDDIRDKGGALFCERRYGTVFTFHNGADSYYSVRGFRGYTLI